MPRAAPVTTQLVSMIGVKQTVREPPRGTRWAYLARMTTPSPVPRDPRDPRVAAVEHNLLTFFHLVLDSGVLATDGHPDVATGWSPVPTPLLNSIIGARFAPSEAADRTRAVLGPYLRRGLPFLWWATPSTFTAAMDTVVREAGLVPQPCPGMHLALPVGAPEPLPAGVEIAVVTPETNDAMLRVLGLGFDLPEDAVHVLDALMKSLPAELIVHVLATRDGEAIACGSLLVTGDTGGLYNIATLAEFRGRGIGRAVTQALLDLARQRDCRQAILHSSGLGRGVYERLGFAQVCQVPQYVWLPPAPELGP